MVKQKKRLRIVMVATFALIIIGGWLCYNFHQNYLDFTLLNSIQISGNQIKASECPWISIIDESYDPFYDELYLQNTYGSIRVNQLLEGIDKEKYSYIVTMGRELKQIAFVRHEARTKFFGIIPRQYIGKVQLSSQQTNKIYLYQMKKINLVHDQYDQDYFLDE